MTMYLGGTYSTPEGNARAGWYGFNGTPSAVFDGIQEHVGGQSGGSMLPTYQPLVVSRMGLSSPLIMNAAYVALGNDINVSVTIQVDEAIANTNNQVQFFVCQDGYHGQTNMVVDILDAETFGLDTPGESTIVSRDFVLASQFNLDDLRIICLVQNTSTKEILQSTLAVADYAGTVVVDAEPDGVNAPWRLQGPEGLDINGAGDRTINLFFTGDYTLSFEDIAGWVAPTNNPQVLNLTDGGLITFTGTYTGGPFVVYNDGPLADTGSGQGAALVDYDNDGDLDIHVVNHGSADQLLRNDGSLVFTNTAAGLIADAGQGRSSAWADLNRDGNLDVYLGRNGEANLLLTGDGAGGFTPASCLGVDDTGPAASVSWVDFDADGNLDLFAANQGMDNVLLHSLGDLGGGFFVFSNTTGGATTSSATNGACWADLNGDQLPELYLVNSFAQNVLLENTPIGFSDISNSSGLNDQTNGVGTAWGDFDNDGDFDLYLSNEGMADHIFINTGDLLFNPLPGELTSDMGNGRGVVWADFNQDTNLDIYLVRHNQPDLFLIGDGLGGFTHIPVGPAEADGAGNAVACGDLDQDGDLDLFITREDQSNVLLANELPVGGFFQLNLVGAENQPDAIGATVSLTADGVTQLRQVTAGNGYLAMDASTLHFGLADATVIDQVLITWPDGTTTTLENLAVNQFMQVSYGQDPLTPVADGSLVPRTTKLGAAFPNPFNPSTTIGFALAQEGPTSLDVFTIDGRLVKTLVHDSLPAGTHQVIWTGQDQSGRNVASGTYFYRLTAADGTTQTGRMALIK